MTSKRRVYVSAPYQSVISEHHSQLKVAILKYLESQGMEPQHFWRVEFLPVGGGISQRRMT
jgi:hypothetical protein